MWFVRGAVAALVSPPGTALALGGLAWCLLVLARRRFWRRVGAAVGLLALGWLWLWATPVASHALRSTLEAQAGPAAVDAVSAAGVMVVLGGLGSLWGAVYGAAAMVLLHTLLAQWTEHWMIVMGPILVGVVLLARAGIWGALGGRAR